MKFDENIFLTRLLLRIKVKREITIKKYDNDTVMIVVWEKKQKLRAENLKVKTKKNRDKLFFFKYSYYLFIYFPFFTFSSSKQKINGFNYCCFLFLLFFLLSIANTSLREIRRRKNYVT